MHHTSVTIVAFKETANNQRILKQDSSGRCSICRTPRLRASIVRFAPGPSF